MFVVSLLDHRKKAFDMQERKEDRKNRFEIEKLEERIAPSAHCPIELPAAEAGYTAGHADTGLMTANEAAGCPV